MQKLVTILLIFICSQTFGRTFYVSNAGNNSSNGLTTATSWLTIAQVNATSLTNGDSVLFNRGDVFYGSLTNPASGVLYSAYGTGAKPIFTGFVTIASWTNLGSNIYEAVVPNALQSVNMVVSNGLIIPMGRYPNANAANGGYLTYEAKDTVAKTITDNQLTNSPNWTGADIVIRKQDYALVRNQVVNHSNTVITLNTRGQFDFRLADNYGIGYGYFFENSLQTLDQNGEWFFDTTSHKIKMYYNSTPPTIQVATISTLINLPSTGSNIVFRNISLQGSESDLAYISYSSNVLIDSCDFFFAGGSGLENRNMTNFTIQNCNFQDNNMTGFYEVSAGNNTGITIQNNNFKRIGMFQGMGVKNNPNYAEGASSTAISAGCPNLIIKNNTIDSVGYCGIIIAKNRNNQIIRQNVISNYCSLKNDGGGIYNAGMRGDPQLTVPTIIDSNIVFSNNDASAGTSFTGNPHCRGIYLDASSSKVNILYNTIYSSYEGMYISQAQYINIKYNTIYGAGKYLVGTIAGSSRFASALNILDANDGYQHTRYNVITNNTFFEDAPNKLFIFQTDRYNGVDSVGIIDSNYYASPMGDYPYSLVNTSDAVAPTAYWFKTWQSKHSVYDAHSTFSNTAIAPYARSFTSANRSPNSAFTSDYSNTTAYSTPTVHTLSWDNTSQITGTGSLKLTASVNSTVNFTQVLQVIGALDSSKSYVLRFKTKAAKVGTFQTQLTQRSGSYSLITPLQYGSIDTVLQQHEILFTNVTTFPTAGVYINFSQDSSTTYIDDIEFYEATATANVMTDYVMFNVNKTNAPVNVGLGMNTYNTLANASLNTVYSVPAYSSSILFKGGAYVAPVYLNPIKLRYRFKRG